VPVWRPAVCLRPGVERTSPGREPFASGTSLSREWGEHVKRLIGAALAGVVLTSLVSTVRAEGKKEGGAADAVIDKAVKALGGMENLGKAHAMSFKTKGTVTIGGEDNKITGETFAQIPGKYRAEVEGEVMGNKIMLITVMSGDKGWRKFNDDVTTFDKDAVANEHRNVYLQLVPTLVFPLKLKQIFKVEVAGEEKVDGKTAEVLKVKGPEGKEFKIFFDKDSGLPLKTVANVAGFMGDDAVQETTYADYKDFDGIKKATKIVTKRGGEKFLNLDVTEFKVLKEVDPKKFEEPK
jgi:hypothetical protein